MTNRDEHTYKISKSFLKFNQLLWRNAKIQNVRSLFYYIDKVLLIGTTNPPKVNTKRKRVLVIYNLALGDGIMFYGVMKNLRRIYPETQYDLSIACQKAFASLYEDSGIFDSVIGMDFSGAVINLGNRKKLFNGLRKVKYDIVIDPVGCEDCTTNVFVTRAVHAETKIGVLDKNIPHQMSDKLRNKIYTRIIEIDEEKIHLIRYYAGFLNQLGSISVSAVPAELPQYSLDSLKVKLPEDFFIVFPIASMAVKKWDEEHYAHIAMKVQEKTGWPLVICGTDHDRVSIEKMLSFEPDINYIDAIGQTSILSFTSLIGKAKLVITNDTSAYHIAVARKVPTVMACGGYTYHRYAKYNYEDKGWPSAKLATHKMSCFDCNNHCKYSDYQVFPCIERITEDNVWKCIEELRVFK